MKKISLFITMIMLASTSFSYMRVANPYLLYSGPEVQEERAEGAAYVPPEREYINSRYGEYIDQRETEFTPDSNANRLFMSYSQP